MQHGIIMEPWQGGCLGGDKKAQDLSQTVRVLQCNSLSRLGPSQNKDKAKKLYIYLIILSFVENGTKIKLSGIGRWWAFWGEKKVCCS